MSKSSKIQWTDATWNPWHGCKKVSPGCKYCYMYRDKERYGKDPTEVLRSSSNFNAPSKWNEPKLIFTCSWSDFFIQESDLWRKEAWEIIKNTPHHTYQILTKRPERIKECLPPDWGDGYDNVWIGVSVESQDQVERIQILTQIPAKVRFISAEPLIGPVTCFFYKEISELIDWVIVGGESGNENGKYRYRPCNLEWINQIKDDCNLAEIPIFVKQLGTHLSKEMGLKDRHGGDVEEWPKEYQVREFPKERSVKIINMEDHQKKKLTSDILKNTPSF